MKIYWYKDSKNVIGPAVKKLRDNKNMTQEDLAAQMQLRGVEIEAVSIARIETGKRFVPDYEVFALADCFKVDMDSLYPDFSDLDCNNRSKCHV